MRNHSKIESIGRVIDANLNRAKEGLRVCEEISRFILNNQFLATNLKKIRHKIDDIAKGLLPKSILLTCRDSLKDIGRDILVNELKRNDINDLFAANIQRVKESIRVLEEFSKLLNKECAVRFKKLRYILYDIEKKSAKKIAALSNR